MNESPWISIIIPVYNAGQYFEECLQTVCGNTQLDIEIILIDDGSTDGSGNTARKWRPKMCESGISSRKIRGAVQPEITA